MRFADCSQLPTHRFIQFSAASRRILRLRKGRRVLYPNSMNGKYKEERNQALLEMRLSGKTYRECGAEFGVTASRAQQICSLQGIRAARSLAQKMAAAGASKQEILSAIRKYTMASHMVEKGEHLIVRNALMKAERYAEIELESGFWTRWINRAGTDIQSLMKRSLAYVDEDIITVDAGEFLHGVCGIFALALNEMFGYPIEALQWICDEPAESIWDGLEHIYCPVTVLGQKGWADVRGITTDWDGFCKEFGDPNQLCVYSDVAPDQLRADLQRDIDHESFVLLYEEAMGLIKAWKNAYDGSDMR